MNAIAPSASFVDLRRFAERVLPLAAPSGLARQCLPLPVGPVSVGVLSVPPGSHEERADADEFVVVHEGGVTLHAGDVAVSLAAGASAVIRAGTTLRWTAEAPASLVFMRYTAAGEGEGGLVPIDPDADLQPSGAPSAELLTTPTPACRNHTDYRSGDGEFMCGTWDSTPYARNAMRYRHYELMHLLDGKVTFVDAAGARGTFGRGDIFLVRQGAECSWDSQVYVRKVYAIWRPA